IVDLSDLWLFLDAYESDLAWLRYGQKVSFTVEAYPGETFTGTISFIEPEMNRKTRTVRIRVDVPNADGRLKPGMFASALVSAQVAAGGQVYVPDLAGKWICPMHPNVVEDGPGQCPECGMDLVPADTMGYVKTAEDSGKPTRPEHVKGVEAPIVIPTSAVLRTGKRAVVYVQLPDQEQPTFEAREIVLGPKAGDVYLVTEGLQEGETVVTHGAFKIDSSLQIQAKPSMMSGDVKMEAGQGTSDEGQMPGMDMGDTDMPMALYDMNQKKNLYIDRNNEIKDIVRIPEQVDNPQRFRISRVQFPINEVQRLLPNYFELQKALSSDNLEAAKEAVDAMAAQTGENSLLQKFFSSMSKREKLDYMRYPYFDQLSQWMVAALQKDPSLYDGTAYYLSCPMANDNQGAPWLQPTDAPSNPYFGEDMKYCSESLGTLGSKAN
ncbi:MAG: efflux RND transporter periplasmic adaptor subunit, partial [Puniceicoccales bacterium]